MGKYLLEGIKPLADAVSLGISIDTILVREGSSFPLVKVTPEIVLELGAQLFDSYCGHGAFSGGHCCDTEKTARLRTVSRTC